jgi:hypothetical protein
MTLEDCTPDAFLIFARLITHAIAIVIALTEMIWRNSNERLAVTSNQYTVAATQDPGFELANVREFLAAKRCD